MKVNLWLNVAITHWNRRDLLSFTYDGTYGAIKDTDQSGIKNGSYTVTVSGFAIALHDSRFRFHSPFSFKAPVFELLRGRFWGFSPRRGDTLQWRWCNLALAWRRSLRSPPPCQISPLSVQISLDLLKGLWSHGGLKLTGSGYPKFSAPPSGATMRQTRKSFRGARTCSRSPITVLSLV